MAGFNTNVASQATKGYPNYAQFNWTLSSQSIANNSSTISWTLKAYGGSNNNRFTNVKEREISINGSKQTLSSVVSAKNGYTFFEGTSTIKHNPDGTATFTASAGLAFFTYGKYNSTGSGVFNLPTIPRASTISKFDSFVIGNNIPWAVDRKHSSYTHTVELWVNGKDIFREPNAGSSGIFVVSDEKKKQMLSLTPNSASAQAVLKVYTYDGNKQIGSVQTKQVIASVGNDIVPVFETIEIKEGVPEVEQKVGQFTQLKSRLDTKIVGEEAGYGATIKSYEILCEGRRLVGKTTITEVVQSSGLVKVIGTVTDSRGRQTSKEVSISVIPYISPLIKNVSYLRCKEDGSIDPLGEHIKIKFTGKVSSLMVDNVEKNKLIYQVKSKKTSEQNYEIRTNVEHNTLEFDSYIIVDNYEFDYSFNVQMMISDVFESSISAGIIPIGEVLQHWARNETAFGMILPNQDYNIHVGPKGLKVHGEIIDKNDKELVVAPKQIFSCSDAHEAWTDGTLRAWGTVSITSKTLVKLYGNNWYNGDVIINFKYPFIGGYHILTTAHSNTPHGVHSSAIDRERNRVRIMCARFNEGTTTVSWEAIGKWK